MIRNDVHITETWRLWSTEYNSACVPIQVSYSYKMRNWKHVNGGQFRTRAVVCIKTMSGKFGQFCILKRF